MDADLFVSEQAVERTVKLAGKSRTIWIREVSHADWFKYAAIARADSLETQSGAQAFIVSKSLCEPDGTLSLTLERAAMLKSHVLGALQTVILDYRKEQAATSGNEPTPGATTSGES